MAEHAASAPVTASDAGHHMFGADAHPERLSSGLRRLDQILGGGLPAHAITLIVGAPGSGKTVLAQQYIFHNATCERPALYFSTVSEPMEKILRYGQRLSFFDPLAVGSCVVYDDIGSILNQGGLTSALERIVEQIKHRRPGLIVIDSFKALGTYADGPVAFRRFLHELAGWLSAFPAACLWVGEYASAEISEAPEFAVADAILELTAIPSNARRLRTLRVQKLRGSDFASGYHAYRISEHGLDVFPRLADDIDPTAYTPSEVRHSSGIEALDQMLVDGYWSGSSTLCAGPSGAGKTLMGLHFVFNAARNGTPGIVASLQENPSQLERVARGFGWTVDHPDVRVMYHSPVDIYIDEWVYGLLDTIDEIGARRVLIDSLTDLQFAAGDDIRFREFMYSLTQRCARRGVSLFMTTEIADLFTVNKLSESGISQLCDNLVLLQYVRDNAAVRRALTVLKTRASSHHPEIREFTITPQGILPGATFGQAPA